MYFLKHFDVALGPRYHGIALAVQAGVSGLVVHMDNRTQELSKETGIPSISIEQALGMTAKQLAEHALWDEGQALDFDANRRRRAAWLAEFLEQNDIAPSPHLLGLA